MKSRNERLSEHLLQTDDAILNTAYEIDDPKKLKAYKKTQSAPITLLPRRGVWVPVVAAAACVALTVGLWQGGVFDPHQLPVEGTVAGTTTTEVDAPTDTTEVTEPTKTDADTTTDGTADTTDTQHPDKTDTTETTKPTATDKTDPTKNTTTGKDKPTTKSTTGKTKPTTKPTTTSKTKPPAIMITGTTTKTPVPNTTTNKDTLLIWADKPEPLSDETPSGSLSADLKIKMKKYKGSDVKYAVIVEVVDRHSDAEGFWQSTEELAQFYKEYYDVYNAYEEEAKRLNPDYPHQEETVWSDKMRENYEYFLTLIDKKRAYENEYQGPHILKVRNQKLNALKEWAETELVPLSTDGRFHPHYAISSDYAFFMELTAEEIEELTDMDGYFYIRLRHSDGDKPGTIIDE